MAELLNCKPCPFCGGKNLNFINRNMGHGELDEWLVCECEAEMGGRWLSRQELIEKWNRRI